MKFLKKFLFFYLSVFLFLCTTNFISCTYEGAVLLDDNENDNGLKNPGNLSVKDSTTIENAVGLSWNSTGAKCYWICYATVPDIITAALLTQILYFLIKQQKLHTQQIYLLQDLMNFL